MPVYEYACTKCEAHLDLRVDAEARDALQTCPQGHPAKRVLYTGRVGWRMGKGGLLKGFDLPSNGGLVEPVRNRRVFGPGGLPKTGGAL